MKLTFTLSTELVPPYINSLEVHTEDKIYIVAEFLALPPPAKTVKRIKNFPGEFDALRIARKKHSDASTRIKVDGVCHEN